MSDTPTTSLYRIRRFPIDLRIRVKAFCAHRNGLTGHNQPLESCMVELIQAGLDQAQAALITTPQGPPAIPTMPVPEQPSETDDPTAIQQEYYCHFEEDPDDPTLHR